MRLLDISMQYPPDAVRTEWQNEAVDMYLDWVVANNGSRPWQKHFGKQPGQVEINESRFFGTGDYRNGGGQFHNRIFSNRDEAMEAIKRRAIERGLSLPWLNS